jgi:hypothetical protein
VSSVQRTRDAVTHSPAATVEFGAAAGSVMSSPLTASICTKQLRACLP